MKELKPKVELDSKENQIIQVLREYTQYFNENLTNTQQQPLTLRITGGWVRDKLLGYPSHDIDIGIDHLSGENFVQGLKSWLDNSSSSEAEISKIHKIKMNPSKSKHLETCTINLFGLDIDFVNLRSETYSQESRIPIIEQGTPSQDSHRRDATLNSLFFNLDTLQVEDLTGKGLDDLKNGILRTPLDPITTFLDDPLRCLRLIRFASTYGFEIDNSTLDAMKLSEIQESLNNKISRERIGVELKKILMNGDVILGFKLLSEVRFGSIWFTGDTPLDPEWIEKNSDYANESSINLMKLVVENLPGIVGQTTEPLSHIISNLLNKNNEDEVERVSFWSSLVLSFWGDQKVKTNVKKGKEAYVSFWCVLNGIKMPMKQSELVSLIVSTHESYVENLNNSIDQLDFIKRSQFAQMFILPYGQHWEMNLVTNYLIEALKNPEKTPQLNEKYCKLYNHLTNLGLQTCYSESIKINGKEIIALLDRKPGPWLKPVNDQLFVYQLDNPACTKEEMELYLKSII